MKDFIALEVSKERDLLEDEKIVRKSGTHPSLTLAASIEKSMQAIKSDTEKTLIEHENIIRRWSPSTESREIGSRLSLQILGSIGILCGCRIEQANDSADLVIKADTEQDLERVILKLEQLNKMKVDPHRSYYCHPTFCSGLNNDPTPILDAITDVSRSVK